MLDAIIIVFIIIVVAVIIILIVTQGDKKKPCNHIPFSTDSKKNKKEHTPCSPFLPPR